MRLVYIVLSVSLVKVLCCGSVVICLFGGLFDVLIVRADAITVLVSLAETTNHGREVVLALVLATIV